jgi:pilus assembly protein FimV
MVRMDTIRKTLIAVSLVLIPAAANAAGLGKLTVFSALGQPFRAEIELVSVSKEELLTLSARLAPPAAFNQTNIEYSSALLAIKFAVDKRAEGEPQALLLSSTNPINEPFLDMLVELNWAAGRLVREYTLLLDPPGYQGGSSVAQAATGATLVAPAAPQTAGSPAVVAPAPVSSVPSAEMKKTETSAPSIVEEKPLGKAPQKALATYEVRRGDTLRKVADQNKPQGVSVEQMLVALYRGNRDAFDGNNMNRLRTGAILRIPEREDAAATGETDSRRLVSAQAADFNAYRRRLAGAVEAAPAAKATGVAQSAKGKITAKIEDKAAPAKPGQDQLKLSSADDKAKAGGAAGKAAKEDDLAARNNAVKEANSRVADLEKTTKDLQKLLEIKNQQLADLQAKVGVKPADTKAVEAKPVETKAAAKPVETKAAPAPAKPEEPKAPAVVPAEAKADAKPGDVKPAEVKAETKPAEAKPAEAKADAKSAAAKPVVKKAPPPEPDLLDQALGAAPYLGGGLVVLIVAGYGFFAYRRRKSISKFEDSIITGGDLKANPVFANTGGQSVDTGGSSLQSIVSESGGGAVDSDEVDPIAEADVYMAYGRDSQAEEILKEALAKDPGRQAIRTKLLEIYFARKDARTFEAIAGELYAATGGSGTEWSKAVELGVQLDPSNTLYGGRAPPRVISPEDTVILPGQMPTDTIVLGGDAPEAPAAGAPAEEIIDLSAPAESAGAGQAEAPAGLDLDFNLDLGDAAPKEQPDVALEAAPSAESGTVDFDLGGTPTAALEAAPSAESGAVDFDLGGTSTAARVETSAINFEAPAPVDVEFDNTSTVAMTDTAYRASIGAPPAASGKLEIPASASESAPKLPNDVIMLGESSEDAFDKTILVDFNTPDEAPPAPVAAPSNGADGAYDARWQEVATKLDLAKAYEEMGDKDGTRELLNEVLKEGDNTQQDQARSILARLG